MKIHRIKLLLAVVMGSLIGAKLGADRLPMAALWVCNKVFQELGGLDHFTGPSERWEMWIGLRSEIPEVAGDFSIGFGVLLGAITFGAVVLSLQGHWRAAGLLSRTGSGFVLLLASLVGLFVGGEFTSEGRDSNGAIFVVGFPLLWSVLLWLWGLWLSRRSNKSSDTQESHGRLSLAILER